MKRWKKIVIGIAAFIALAVIGLALGGLALSPDVQIRVDKRLAASPQKLFPLLHTPAGLSRWWAVAMQGMPGSPMTVRKQSGPDQGPGMTIVFEQDGSVLETWLVTAAQPDASIGYDVDFAGMFTVKRVVTLKPDGTGTQVEWVDSGRFDNPLLRWMTVLMPPSSIEKNFRDALGALDKAALQEAAVKAP